MQRTVARYVELERAAHGADDYTIYGIRTYLSIYLYIYIYRGRTSFPESVGLAQARPNYHGTMQEGEKKSLVSTAYV